MTSANVMITGANGFVGIALVAHLARNGHRIRAAVRRTEHDPHPGVDIVNVGDMDGDTHWRPSLEGMDIVVHCAARVHVMRESAADPLLEFRRVNVAGTLNLARNAVAAKVRRFIYISSIGVNGAETFGKAFSAADQPRPHSPYAVSKHEAELALQQLAQVTGLEVVIIRPPLIFGPNAPGNFNKLMQALDRGIPLPLGAIKNNRSLVSLDNLVDLITICLNHPNAARQTFLVSDDEDVSTTDLLRRVAAALGRPARLIPVPAAVLRAAARALGKAEFAQRLCGSLQVDISPTRQLLDWAPVMSLNDALAATARHYLAQARR